MWVCYLENFKADAASQGEKQHHPIQPIGEGKPKRRLVDVHARLSIQLAPTIGAWSHREVSPKLGMPRPSYTL